MTSGSDSKSQKFVPPIDLSLIHGSIWIFILNVCGMGLMFILNIVLARVLGAAQFGHYAFAISWISILAIAGTLGWDVAAVRIIPKLKVEEKYGQISGLIRGSLLMSTGTTIALVGMVAIIGLIWVPGRLSWILVLIAGTLTVILANLGVVSGVMKGLKLVVFSQAINMVVRPTLFLCGLGIFLLVDIGSLGPMHALLLNIGAALSCLLILLHHVRKRVGQSGEDNAWRSNARSWLGYALPMFVVVCVNVMFQRLGVVVVGFYLDPISTGQFAACTQISAFAGFGLLIAGVTVQPTLSELYSRGEIDAIRPILRWAARIALLLSLPVIVVILFYGDRILGLMSREFVPAHMVLKVLAMNQLICVVNGLVGTLLVMTDRQRTAGYILGSSAVVYSVLLFVLVPSHGILGAAYAGIVATIGWNSIMSLFVWRQLGVRTMAF